MSERKVPPDHIDLVINAGTAVVVILVLANQDVDHCGDVNV